MDSGDRGHPTSKLIASVRASSKAGPPIASFFECSDCESRIKRGEKWIRL